MKTSVRILYNKTEAVQSKHELEAIWIEITVSSANPGDKLEWGKENNLQVTPCEHFINNHYRKTWPLAGNTQTSWLQALIKIVCVWAKYQTELESTKFVSQFKLEAISEEAEKLPFCPQRTIMANTEQKTILEQNRQKVTNLTVLQYRNLHFPLNSLLVIDD